MYPGQLRQSLPKVQRPPLPRLPSPVPHQASQGAHEAAAVRLPDCDWEPNRRICVRYPRTVAAVRLLDCDRERPEKVELEVEVEVALLPRAALLPVASFPLAVAAAHFSWDMARSRRRVQPAAAL
ncbi:MAG: hypothetical protein ACRD2G_02595 [Terriglobia bacterium]